MPLPYLIKLHVVLCLKIQSSCTLNSRCYSWDTFNKLLTIIFLGPKVGSLSSELKTLTWRDLQGSQRKQCWMIFPGLVLIGTKVKLFSTDARPLAVWCLLVWACSIFLSILCNKEDCIRFIWYFSHQCKACLVEQCFFILEKIEVILYKQLNKIMNRRTKVIFAMQLAWLERLLKFSNEVFI